jgi:GNAT superfamily N-acetyltransferase
VEPLIRLARPEDAGGIALVHIRSWQQAYRGLMPAALLAGLSLAKWTLDWQERLAAPARTTLVLEDAGVIQGWVAFGPARGEDDAGDAGEVYGIYLAPEYWSKSLGKRLLVRAEDLLRQSGHFQISLWVVDANVRARRFYEKLGYLRDGSDREIDRGGMALNQLRYSKRLPRPGE